MHPLHILHKCNAGHCETCVKSLRSINIKSVPTHVAKVAKFAQRTLDLEVDIRLSEADYGIYLNRGRQKKYVLTLLLYTVLKFKFLIVRLL